jgi:hypothetical protein
MVPNNEVVTLEDLFSAEEQAILKTIKNPKNPKNLSITKQEMAAIILQRNAVKEAIAFLERNIKKHKKTNNVDACHTEKFVMQEVLSGRASVIPARIVTSLYKALGVTLQFQHPLIYNLLHLFLLEQIQEGLVRTDLKPKPNRTRKDKTVNDYHYSMVYDLWFPNGDCIKYDEDGNPGDGQNRFAGANNGNKEFISAYVYGLPERAILASDTGASKVVTDITKMTGIQRPIIAGNVVSLLHNVRFHLRTRPNMVVITYALDRTKDFGDFVNTMYDYIDSMFNKKKEKRGWTETHMKREVFIAFLWAIHNIDIELGKRMVTEFLGLAETNTFSETKHTINETYRDIMDAKDAERVKAKKSGNKAPNIENMRDDYVLYTMLQGYAKEYSNTPLPVVYGKLTAPLQFNTLVFPHDERPDVMCDLPIMRSVVE